MSSDLVVLARREPDVYAVADGLVALGEPLEVVGGGLQAVRVRDAGGRVLVSVEEPVLVETPGEVARLLGPAAAQRVAAPVWWVDVRAVADVPDAVRLARRFADALVHWTGGTVWPDLAPDAPALSWKVTNAPAAPGA
ncbi:hypothetical protein GCM10023085_59330 [Actinomadura viridis]|uniref:Uncharacterized protein n=1 Tax=Actinomadura viridis TaxID=58110 RepID=A0A931GMJ0_9ACTN|nr:hypothetical protein [Actinomadura viridis]MBG6093273.1 hypothetical protein [Actinomadura viridis]